MQKKMAKMCVVTIILSDVADCGLQRKHTIILLHVRWTFTSALQTELFYCFRSFHIMFEEQLRASAVYKRKKPNPQPDHWTVEDLPKKSIPFCCERRSEIESRSDKLYEIQPFRPHASTFRRRPYNTTTTIKLKAKVIFCSTPNVSVCSRECHHPSLRM